MHAWFKVIYQDHTIYIHRPERTVIKKEGRTRIGYKKMQYPRYRCLKNREQEEEGEEEVYTWKEKMKGEERQRNKGIAKCVRIEGS